MKTFSLNIHRTTPRDNALRIFLAFFPMVLTSLFLSGCIQTNDNNLSYDPPEPSPRKTYPVSPPTFTPPSPTPIPSTSPSTIPSPTPTSFTIRGTITYDHVPALDGVNEPGPKLDYSAKTARPARRVSIQALEGTSILSETTTNDAGQYALSIPLGKSIKVRVRSVLRSAAYTPDGISSNFCNGASWDIKVVDNTNSKAIYVMDSPNLFNSTSENVNLHAPLTISGNTYSNRAAAPFALLDTLVNSIELTCQGRANINFPLLIVNWSSNNIDIPGDKATGRISTSHFTTEGGVPNLYILGKENADTDEYDDHVIAHEFGHYLEHNLYRSDTLGGSHAQRDSLDPRVAFSEGFGNAISAMTFNDPYYVDTRGDAQSSGFVIRMNQAPTGDDRGVYSETSVQHILWSLYENRDATSNHGNFDKIHTILENQFKNSPAFTSLQSFASYYNQVYGGLAESFQSLWVNILDLPYSSLCANGICTGSNDIADPFDLDNDIGFRFCTGCTSSRKYQQSTGSTFAAPFWMLYRQLNFGTNLPNAHDQTNLANYSVAENKFGAVRWYFIFGTGGVVNVTLDNLGGGVNCSSDILDLYVYKKGKIIASNEDSSGSEAGCPSVSFLTSVGEVYLITVNAYTGDARISVPSWTMTVQ